MIKDLRRRLATAGKYTVTYGQSVAYIEGAEPRADMTEAARLAATVFGFNAISRAIALRKVPSRDRKGGQDPSRALFTGEKDLQMRGETGG